MDGDDLSSQKCAALLKVLADKERLRILQLLRQGPLTVSDIAEFLSVEIANVSHHLGVLRRNDLVRSERDGKNIYYELAPNTLQNQRGTKQHLNLGCCRLEIPKKTDG
jgi:DNA-binding transcriptional ArsR family regulator